MCCPGQYLAKCTRSHKRLEPKGLLKTSSSPVVVNQHVKQSHVEVNGSPFHRSPFPSLPSVELDPEIGTMNIQNEGAQKKKGKQTEPNRTLPFSRSAGAEVKRQEDCGGGEFKVKLNGFMTPVTIINQFRKVDFRIYLCPRESVTKDDFRPII